MVYGKYTHFVPSSIENYSPTQGEWRVLSKGLESRARVPSPVCAYETAGSGHKRDPDLKQDYRDSNGDLLDPKVSSAKP